MTAPALRGTRIGRLRVRLSGGDPQLAAERCALALRSLELRPPAMPPQAILCVRTLADPMPRGVDVRSRNAHVRPLAWESAMRAVLGAMLQRVARPIDGPVPADAEAVFFADEAEMLACASHDACRGLLSWFWWWRHLLRETSFEAVVAAWCDAPTYMPAAFESLARIGAAASWIRRLTPSSATALLDATLRAHALPALADGIAAACREVEAPGAEQRAAPATRAGTAVQSAHRPESRPSDLASPWRGAVPPEWDAPMLPLVPRTFAAMCIVLRRSSWLPRTEGFSRAVVSYLRDARRAERRDHATVNGAVSRDEMQRQPLVRPLAPQWSALAAVSESHELPSERERRPSTKGQFGDVSPATDSDHVLPAPAARRRRSISPRERGAEALVDSTHTSLSSVTPLHSHADASPESETASAAEQPTVVSLEAVESDYAGAFFLIDVALDLELYSHGIAVVEDLPLSIWRFIELVAGEFLSEHDVTEPLWELLMGLAEPPRGPALPDRAPDLLPDERARLIERVRAHLEELLDVEDPGTFLIRRRGRIARTPGHLDVRFPLEHHPIEIRVARLDRNPGWIPAAGVHVGFYFD